MQLVPRSLLISPLVAAALILLMGLALTSVQAVTAEGVKDAPAPDGIRPGGTLTLNGQAPPIANERSSMRRPTRNFPEQPPMIPHGIQSYQLDERVNQCLMCHSRSTTNISGAPMVSITHFVDREGQTLAAVSPRRYFCTQCHVPQLEVEPAKISTFKGIDQVLEEIIKRGE